MPKPVAEVGEGHEDASGNGVYCFIRDLIVEGRDARFVDKKGRYVINWSRALKCYHDYKSKRNPQYKSKNINRRKASNGLRAALLNFYKKEGAKEYKDCKKVNERDEVVERQFQMPPRVFESLFGSDVQLSYDSSEHETSSIVSEADEKPLATPNSSDTGFDEVMDISDDLFNANEDPSSHCALGGLPAGDPLCRNVKTEEDQGDPSDVTTPCQMFRISEEDLDLVIGEICSSSDTNDIDQLGVVRDICPSSGSVKGGMQFYISLTEELSEDDKSGIAHFDGIGDVCLERLNCYTFAGTIPASQKPGTVPVTVNTQDGRLLGMTSFTYVDEIQEALKQVVKDPALQSLYVTMWSQEYDIFGNVGNQDAFALQGQGSSIQGTHAQALKGLQLLVYTAAQTNAQQFIQMIFSTSAGRLIFNAYKDRPQLPEDVARANGHDDLAQYLQDVNTRLSKENTNDAQSSSIDWLELIEAVNKIQKQSSVIEDETDLETGQSKDDDNQSDYFADAETSSCGSFELEIGWCDSEDGEGRGSDKEPDVKSAPNMKVTLCKTYMYAEVETQSDNDLGLEDDESYEEGEVKEVCDIGCFGQQIGVATQKRENTSEREQDARKMQDQEKRMQLKSPLSKDERPKKEPDERLTPSMEGASSEAPTVWGTRLGNEIYQKADGKNDRKLSTTEVWKSSLISQLSKTVAASGREEEASTVHIQKKTTKPKRTRKWLKGDDVTTSSQQGPCVNETEEVPSFRERFFQRVTGGGTQNRENISERKEGSTTGPSQAKRHKQRTQLRPCRRTLLKSFFLWTIAVTTVLCLAPEIEFQETQRLCVNGSLRISQVWLSTPIYTSKNTAEALKVNDMTRYGCDYFKNRNGNCILHLASRSGHQQCTEFLISHGSERKARDNFQPKANVNDRNNRGQSPLHLVAEDGNKHVVHRFSISYHERDVSASDNFGKTPLQLVAINGHESVVDILCTEFRRFLNTTDNLKQTRFKFYSRDASVIWPRTFLKHLESGRLLKDLLKEKFYHTLNNKVVFLQVSGDLIHWATQPFHAPVNLFIGLGDDFSGPRDYKLRLDKPSATLCLGISLGRRERISRNINPGIKYFNTIDQNSAHQGLRSKYTSLIDHPFCRSCSIKLARNRRTKDRESTDAKFIHSFGYMNKSIKDSTNKVLIRSELPHKEIAYESGNPLVNATVLLLLLLITLFTLCTVLRIGLYHLVEIIRMKVGVYNGCQATSNSSTGVTASETNGLQNRQSSPPVQEDYEDSVFPLEASKRSKMYKLSSNPSNYSTERYCM